MTKLIDAGKVDGGKRALGHLIEAEHLIRKLSWSSRLNGDREFRCIFMKWGAGAPIIAQGHWTHGVASTVKLEEKFYGGSLRRLCGLESLFMEFTSGETFLKKDFCNAGACIFCWQFGGSENYERSHSELIRRNCHFGKSFYGGV